MLVVEKHFASVIWEMFDKLLIHVSLDSESKSLTDVFQHGKPCNFLVKEYSFPETTSSVLLSGFPVGFFFHHLWDVR